MNVVIERQSQHRWGLLVKMYLIYLEDKNTTFQQIGNPQLSSLIEMRISDIQRAPQHVKRKVSQSRTTRAKQLGC